MGGVGFRHLVQVGGVEFRHLVQVERVLVLLLHSDVEHVGNAQRAFACTHVIVLDGMDVGV